MLEKVIEKNAIRIGPRCYISFQRTLRIPDDGRVYPLPPGLGTFRIHRVNDYRDNLPQEWQSDGSVFISMYQREALWIGFRGASWKPNAVKIETGGETDLVMKLYGPDSQTLLIAEDDDSGQGYNPRITADLVAGEYLIQIRHYNTTGGTGSYGIKVSK